MATGTHAYEEDPRNETVLIYVNGELTPRPEAKISVFDSGFLLGDGMWEGMRLHHGKLAFQDQHLVRLYENLKAVDIDIGMTKDTLAAEILRTCSANGMTDNVHIRLVVTRGLKKTPYQHPNANVGGPTIVIIPEYKRAREVAPLSLFTVHVIRGAPNTQDPKWNSLSKLNCIAACIQADKAGTDEALMLDPHGFVATCNSTHFFIIRDGEVWTSTGDYCLPGITRGNVVALCRKNNIPVFEKNFSLTEVYSAEEAFVTGTFGGLTPVANVDGRTLENSQLGPMTARLRELYRDLIERNCT
ncbi:MAG: aminotransferase class IV [Rhodospirillaceae bacterium]|jgi:branched-chain amino acid aminotransferase|nr:aminotransferase class IV [Rhodospirillaceae bacterium]|tara:strand:- start:831 stop:1733 length:903 start_codon:yes stop_codon:yes gene_type:complete